jgi:type I restriction enzyme S subunit
MTLPFVIQNSSFGISTARLATAQKTVERLTPATLAKAFRGELVPQDPNDESASTLIERITATKEAAPAKSKPKTRRVAKR